MESIVGREGLMESLFDDTGLQFGEEQSLNPGDSSPTEVLNDMSNSRQSQASFDSQIESVVEDCWVPKSGMVVGHVIEAFVKYSNYARSLGFQIRFRSSEKKATDNRDVTAGRRRRMTRGLGRSWFYSDYDCCSRVRLQCVKGELPKVNRRDPNRPARSQSSKCLAGVSLLNKGDGTWMFSTVRLEHNHVCDPATTRFMKNYRIVETGDELQIVVSDRAGVTPSRLFTSFAVGYGGIERVPFSAEDCRSVVREARSRGMENGDFNAMQKLFNDLIASSPGFFYSYDTDDDGRVKNVFWADARSRGACKEFGDVVCFDTTHLKNRYKMPLAPFIGVNHHGQSILLGLALVSSEDTESFSWVFEAWMKCMSNKSPKCIMTDQCQAIGNAISYVFPNASHRWCLWHIMRNAEQHLKKKKDWVDIRKDLKEAVHDAINVESFEGMWNLLVIKYELHDNVWISRMFDLRERWVPVYFSHEFWDGIHSNQRSEGMNNFFRSYVNINTTLRQFLQQYCLFVGKRADDEERENWRSENKPILCATRFPCELILQKIYTSQKFFEIQKEAKGVAYNNIELLTSANGMSTFIVTDQGVEKVFGSVLTRRFSVVYKSGNHETVCECNRFAFRGIICRHMIAVWQGVELRLVPRVYILDRWRKDIFREYALVTIPNYSLAFDKTGELRKVGELQKVLRDITSSALGCDDLYNALMPGLQLLKRKCDQFIENMEDICVDSVGRFYKRKENEENCSSVPDMRVEFVLDPPDRRGRGRAPVRRKGYRKEKRQRPVCVSEQSVTHQLFA